MKTYWDLSERDRAALTIEQVEKYLDAELMTKGVLSVPPLELVPEPAANLSTVTAYVVEGFDSIAFPDEGAARKFLALGPSVVERDWRLDVEAFKAPKKAPNILARQIAHESSVQAAQATLKQASEARTENDKRRRAHEEANREVKKALEGLWEDYWAQRERAAKMQQIADTFEKYKGLAGDEAVARKFLEQAFPAPVIAAAEQWFGRAFGAASEAAE